MLISRFLTGLVGSIPAASVNLRSVVIIGSQPDLNSGVPKGIERSSRSRSVKSLL